MDDDGYYNTRARSKRPAVHRISGRRRNPSRKVKPVHIRDDLDVDDLQQLESSEEEAPKRSRTYHSSDDSSYGSEDCSSDEDDTFLASAAMRKDMGQELQLLRQDSRRNNQRVLGSMLMDALLREEEGSAGTDGEEDQYLRTLSCRERREYRRKEQAIIRHNKSRIPLKCRVVQMDMQASSKLCILDKWDTLQRMDESSGEYPKLKTWVDAVMKIPFGRYEQVPVELSDGAASIRQYLRSIQRALDSTVHGHITAKGDIMQLVSQWISNPRSMSKVLGIAGPPGTGKTTLVRHGIAKALGRPFVQISLGGATDSCTLNGHSYTYEGAIWGKIAASLMQSRTMNPVLFFDELDKVSESKTGQEIIGLLIHLTDSTQNDQFVDRYFEGVPLDLSRALIIFSFNDEERLCPILKDRMTVVSTESFSVDDKIQIATKHLLPAVLDNAGFNRKDVYMEPDDVRFCINYVPKEEGVRNLRRAIESAVMKLNVLRLTGGTIREGKADSMPELPYRIRNLHFPFHLSAERLPKLVSKIDTEGGAPEHMYT